MIENVLLYFMFILNIAGFGVAKYISNFNLVKISFPKVILTKQ